jgi:uncharacterized SAM-binding protein YcdF (DUF218 family)
MTASGMATVVSRLILLAVLAATILVLADFLRFADRATAATPTAPAGFADAIVVYTGRSNARVRTGVALLEQGRAQRLLISGVNRTVRPQELRQIAGGALRTWECCIALGHEARDTVGNARELAAWAGRSGVSSIILVTGNYHMERAVLETRAVLPDLPVTPWPVAQTPLAGGSWWGNQPAIRALVQEYIALQEARLRLFLRIDLKETV